jgi:hypothetical protein
MRGAESRQASILLLNDVRMMSIQQVEGMSRRNSNNKRDRKAEMTGGNRGEEGERPCDIGGVERMEDGTQKCVGCGMSGSIESSRC